MQTVLKLCLNDNIKESYLSSDILSIYYNKGVYERGKCSVQLCLIVCLYLHFYRRGNWITLKLRKLIKSGSRDTGPEHPPSPTHTTTEPQLLCHDNSSFVDGLSSTPAGHETSPQRSSREYERLTNGKPYIIRKSPRTTSSPRDQEESPSSWLLQKIQPALKSQHTSCLGHQHSS